ncbi:hypothetical protein D3C86_1396980 [compost metagenome]
MYGMLLDRTASGSLSEASLVMAHASRARVVSTGVSVMMTCCANAIPSLTVSAAMLARGAFMSL